MKACSRCHQQGHYAKTCKEVSAPAEKIGRYISHKIDTQSVWGIKSHPTDQRCELC
jgi:hypothetical protein